MVISHIIKAVGKATGSKIQTEKTIKTAQALVKANTGGGTQKEKEIAALRQMLKNAEQKRIKSTANSAAAVKQKQAEVAALKTILQKANKQKQKGTGVKGGNTKNDKTIDKKIKKQEKAKAKVLNADQIRILKNQLPIVKRKGNFRKSTNKNQPLTPKGSGVDIAPLPKTKYSSMYGPTNQITAKDLKPFAFNAANKVISTKKFKKDLSSLDPWKKKDKVTGLGLGVGGAGMFALGTQPSQAEINAEKYLKKSKDERWGYW